MKQYLILIRPYGMLFLGFTPVFCAMANGEFSSFNLSILLIIGIFTHIFTFVQNDYFDIQVDKKSRYVSNRPIVTGKVTKTKAHAIFMFSMSISIIFAIVFIYSIYSLITLFFAFFFITIYNKFSKRYYGMEYFLGLGVLFFGLFGAFTVSEKISNLAIIISIIGFMQWLFSVGISANLKDVEYDIKLGIRTTPTKFGVKVSEEKLIIPSSFILYAFLIKILHIILIFLPFILGYTSIFVYDLPIPAMLFIIVTFFLIYLTKEIFSASIEEREKMLIYVGLQEGLSLLLIPIVLMSLLIKNIGLIFTFLIFLILIIWPLFWFRVLFGKKMIPLE